MVDPIINDRNGQSRAFIEDFQWDWRVELDEQDWPEFLAVYRLAKKRGRSTLNPGRGTVHPAKVRP